MNQSILIEQVKATIEKLIQAGTSFDTDELEVIYHKNFQIVMVDEKGQKMIADKEAFKNLFASKKQNGDLPLNTWAEYHHIAATDNSAHVIVTRKVNLTGEERKLTLSIDLSKEDQRWQVIREVIFSQPI